MEGTTLEFDGIRGAGLLWWLLAGVMLALVLQAVWRFVAGRWRDGVLCLSGVAPPLAVLVLVCDAAARSSKGDLRGAKSSLLGAGIIAAGTVGVIAVYVADGGWGAAAWMAVLALEIAVAVGLFYAAVFAYLGTRRMAILMALRCAAILALLLILFKPSLSTVPDLDAYRTRLPILLDRSGSMETTDQGGDTHRYKQALYMLGSQRKKIHEHFKPLWSHFAVEALTAETLDDLTGLDPKGEGADGTDLAAAIRKGAQGEDPRNLAGLLLVSDGIHNGGGPIEAAVAEAGVPIYTVGVGSEQESETGRRNIRILAVEAPFKAIKNNTSTLRVRVEAVGFKNISSEVHLLEEGGDEPVATAPLWTDQNVADLKAELKWTPRDRGEATGAGAKRAEVRKLRIAIPANPAETVAADNDTEVHVLVTEPRIRVLYVEGSIRPEYKFLRWALNTDQNVQLVSMIRIQGNRFSAYGTVDGQRPLDMPRTEKDFKMYDVIVLGSLDSTFLTRAQQANCKKFVNDGGGLLMLGGQNSMGPGGYADTEIGAVLPVLVGSRSQPQESTPFLPRVTAYGQRHPIFEGIAKYFIGRDGKKPTIQGVTLPELRGCVTVVGARQGAEVLALHPSRGNEKGPLIVLAVQQFGGGRSAAFTADTTWLWYLPLRGMGAKSPYRLFWGQMVRWLANVKTKSGADAPSVLLRLSKTFVRVGKNVKILAQVQNAKGEPTDAATVTAAIGPVEPNPRVQTETIPLAGRRSEGMFEADFRPTVDGKYRIKVTASDSGGASLGEDELVLTAAPQSAEMDRLARNTKGLQAIANASRGRYAELSALPELLDHIVQQVRGRTGFVPAPEKFPLYNFVLLFLLFVALLTAEWILRRRWQLQ